MVDAMTTDTMIRADENPTVTVRVTGLYRTKEYEVPLDAGDHCAAARAMFHAEFEGIGGTVWSVALVDSVVTDGDGAVAVVTHRTGKGKGGR